MKSRIPHTNFFLTALCYLLSVASMVSFFSIAIWSLISRDSYFLVPGLAATAGAFVFFRITQVIFSGPACCPLCRAEAFANRKCPKSTKAKSFFGNYRIPLALNAIRFAERLCCVFCGTSFRYTGESRQQLNPTTVNRRKTQLVSQLPTKNSKPLVSIKE